MVTIEAIAIWVRLNVLVIPAIEKHTGAFANMLRNLAMLPPVVIKEAVKVATLTEADGEERLLTPVEAAQVGLVWRITRRKLSGNWASWVDVDPFEAPSDPGAAPPTVKVVEASSTKTTNPSSHSQTLDTYGQPDEEETLTALNVRVVVQLGSPYADFAVSTHYARKTTRAHRFTASAWWLVAGERDSRPSQLSGTALLLESLSCGVLNVEGGARDAFGPLPAENREGGNPVANSLAPCLLGGRQVHVRALESFEVANRVRHLSRTRPSYRREAHAMLAVINAPRAGRTSTQGQSHQPGHPPRRRRLASGRAFLFGFCGRVERPLRRFSFGLPLFLLQPRQVSAGRPASSQGPSAPARTSDEQVECSSSKRRKGQCWQRGRRLWYVRSGWGERSGDYVPRRRSRLQRILV